MDFFLNFEFDHGPGAVIVNILICSERGQQTEKSGDIIDNGTKMKTIFLSMVNRMIFYEIFCLPK